MLTGVKTIYKRGIAGIMLFTAETIILVALFLSSLIAFLAIAKYVFMDRKEDFDTAVFDLLEGFIKPGLTNIMQFLSVIGNYQVMIAANFLLIAYFLFVRKHKWYSIKIPAISLSTLLLMSLLKQLFNRPRPLIPLMEPARGLSFPSGHAMMSATFFGLIIYFVYRQKINNTLKAVIITLLVLFILSIGLSRIYLRVHYASDVLAGFSMGVIWLTIAVNLLNRIERFSKEKMNAAVEVNG
jgi:undecaprenyl-diphosphatase